MAAKKLKPPKVDRSSTVVKSSPIHGKGVFVAKPIKKGQAIIEYKGERISWKLAQKRHPHDPKDPNHTFYFSLEDGRVIDAKYGGNAARWINHSCKPICETREDTFDGEPRVFIYAKRALKVGEELFYDYSLDIEGKITKQIKKIMSAIVAQKSVAAQCWQPKIAQSNFMLFVTIQELEAAINY